MRRIRKPGTKFDQIIVLEGPEGINKSKLIELLAGAENFSDQSLLTMSDRQQQEAMGGRWLYEIADLRGIHNADIDALKAFASRRTDRARPAYGRFNVDQPRTCILFATTNDREYLRGGNGNRRWWPLTTTQINIDAVKRDRDQLWAEAAKQEAEGASIVLDGALWPAAALEQERRRVKDLWEDALADVTGTRWPTADGGEEERISSLELWQDVLEMKAAQLSDTMSKRLATCMRKLGLGWPAPDAGAPQS